MEERIDFSRDNQIVRLWVLSTIVYGFAGLLYGLLVALQLVVPEMNLAPYFTFGRMRPIHTNGIIFGMIFSSIFATMYYSFPRLLKTPMWNHALSHAHFWLYQLTLVGAVISYHLGYSQSREYAELEWPLDVLVAIWWVILSINFFMTLVIRKEKHIYVAIWFFISTIVTIAMLYIVNNAFIPTGLFKSYSVYAGTTDANIQWWYGHNAVAFVLTTPILGMMYYYLPKHTKLPIFSHRISIVHFWSLIFVYIWAGPHHLLYSPVPDWAQTLGMTFSIILLAPSWGGMINGFLTLTQAKEKLRTDATLKFLLVAITFYGMSTFEGPMMSIRAVNQLSHDTDWVVGHVHSGALGWNAGMAFTALYYLVPRLWNARLHSEAWAETHFWLATVGLLLYVVTMWASGITEGLMWREIGDNGQLVNPNWITIVSQLTGLRWGRALGGLLFFSGFILMAVNLFITMSRKGEGFVETDLREGA